MAKKIKKKEKKLTAKQELFCEYFAGNLNATKSYQMAYGCSYHTARVEGNKSLANPAIKFKTQELKKEKYSQLMLEENDFVLNQKKIAFADITDFVDFYYEDGKNRIKLKNSKEIDSTAIAQIKIAPDGVSVKLKDSDKALERLIKYYSVMEDKRRYEIEEHKMQCELKRLQIQILELKAKAHKNVEEQQTEGNTSFVDAIKGVKAFGGGIPPFPIP
jgi:phage terminase small subunit